MTAATSTRSALGHRPGVYDERRLRLRLAFAARLPEHVFRPKRFSFFFSVIIIIIGGPQARNVFRRQSTETRFIVIIRFIILLYTFYALC